MSTTILLVDDHDMFRSGLRAMLEREPRLQIVGEAKNGRAAVELATKLRPNLIIMDVSMPEEDGIRATRTIRSQSSDTKVIALSCYHEAPFVEKMLDAGANGYIPKEAAFDELKSALPKVLAGETYLSAGLNREELGSDNLSSRERQILRLLAEGMSMKQVAMALHISVKTVETHRRNLMSKLSIDSVAGLTKYAVRHGLTSLDQPEEILGSGQILNSHF